jgi:hypothetical protein
MRYNLFAGLLELSPLFEISLGLFDMYPIFVSKDRVAFLVIELSFSKYFMGVEAKVETPYHDNDLILTPIISPQSG